MTDGAGNLAVEFVKNRNVAQRLLMEGDWRDDVEIGPDRQKVIFLTDEDCDGRNHIEVGRQIEKMLIQAGGKSRGSWETGDEPVVFTPDYEEDGTTATIRVAGSVLERAIKNIDKGMSH